MGAQGHVDMDCNGDPEARNPLEAHAAFFTEWLDYAKTELLDADVGSLTIVLPLASSEHDAWRRAIAGDLAREYTPKRVNIAAGKCGEALDTLLTYLRDAPGVTGHYVKAHD